MGFQWTADGLGRLCVDGEGRIGQCGRWFLLKCRSDGNPRAYLVSIMDAFRAHFGVACLRTVSGRLESDRVSVEALMSCHRRTSLAWTGSGLHGSKSGRGLAVRRPA